VEIQKESEDKDMRRGEYINRHFWFMVCYAATHLMTPLHQRHIQVVDTITQVSIRFLVFVIMFRKKKKEGSEGSWTDFIPDKYQSTKVPGTRLRYQIEVPD